MAETPEPIEILNQLPAVLAVDSKDLAKARASRLDTIIVLDDDPTGTQTVHDIPVLTEWSVDSLINEFQTGTPLFYILTNSRSLVQSEAINLAHEIGRNIKSAAEQAGIRFWVISRSDSTLRGHYPAEVTALEEAIGQKESVHFIIPAFFEGGRYTINDIHYVQQGDQLLPAASTPYAQDPVFGFENSQLQKWVNEKTGGKIDEGQVACITINDLRTVPHQDLVSKLAGLKPGSCCVVNAAAYSDLRKFSQALLESGITPMMRTAASLVAALGGMEQKELLSGKDLVTGKGGLVVAGSFVSTTTAQLNHLFEHRPDVIKIELSVTSILEQIDDSLRKDYTRQVESHLSKGKVVVIYTSRELVKDTSEEKNQAIGRKVSEFLIGILKDLSMTPGFLVSKGGITSSDVATKALGVKKAMVRGQIIKGVPVWQTGSESKFPGLHQVIFPGNVGSESSLTEVINLLT